MTIINAAFIGVYLSVIDADLVDKILDVIRDALNGDPASIFFLVLVAILLVGAVVFLIKYLSLKTKSANSSDSASDATPVVHNEINIQPSQNERSNSSGADTRAEEIAILKNKYTILSGELRKHKETLSKCEEELNERKDFVGFIEYMFAKDFTILPKICLAVDRSKEYNQIDIRKITAIYEYDMGDMERKGKRGKAKKMTPTKRITYNGRVMFCTEAVNHDLPGEYIRYTGNMYADKLVPVFQKHGTQTSYNPVPYKMKDDKTEIGANIGRYPWRLLPESIEHNDTVNIDYYWDYKESGTAEGSTTIIQYPKSYGRKIDSFEIKVIFKSERIKLKEMTLYRIGKTGKAGTYDSTYVTNGIIIGNKASLSFIPNNRGYEAYYAIVKWGLA